MIFTCLATGSDGNAYLLESEKSVLIIEAGKRTFKKIIAALPEEKKLIGAICSHRHSDHFGDIPKVEKITTILEFENNRFDNEDFTIIRFPVWHNVECFGFAVYCKDENKTLVFMTDFAKMIDRSVYGLKVDFLAIELSYNQMIQKEMTPEQAIGLEYHCSDYHSIGIMKKFFAKNPYMKTVTLHKSERACNHSYTNKALYRNFGLKAEIVSIGRKYRF